MIISKGSWGPYTHWTFHVEESQPNKNIVAAAIIVFNNRNEVLLTFNSQRGKWEIPGGHIELNETLVEAANRELYEEGGIKVNKLTPFGFTIVVNDKDVINKVTSQAYPSPSHSVYYYAFSDEVPMYPLSAEECDRSDFFPLSSVEIPTQQKKIIQYVFKNYIK